MVAEYRRASGSRSGHFGSERCCRRSWTGRLWSSRSCTSTTCCRGSGAARAPARPLCYTRLVHRLPGGSCLAARVLHSIFYIRSAQPHRTIAFAVGSTLTFVMLVSALISVA